MEALQRRMEGVVLGLPSGSYAQRVQVRGQGRGAARERYPATAGQGPLSKQAGAYICAHPGCPPLMPTPDARP